MHVQFVCVHTFVVCVCLCVCVSVIMRVCVSSYIYINKCIDT